MAEDWSDDVRKYAPDAHESVIDEIVRYCGVSLRSRDSSLVAFSDPAELGLVKQNYLRKKLGLTEPESELDAALAAVGQRMKADRTKNRVTVYYLLAEHFRKLSLFGGDDFRPAAAATAFAATAAAAPAVASVAAARPDPVVPPTPSYVRGGAAATPAAPSLMRWLPWLILALLLVALLAWLMMRRAPAPTPAATLPAVVAPAAVTPAPTATAPAVAPFPANVFFDTDSSAIKPEGVQALRTAADAARASGKGLAITGYTDRTGDLASNEKLAKDRAVAVRDQLVADGVPLASIEMRPPVMVEIGASGPDADARRVQVVER